MTTTDPTTTRTPLSIPALRTTIAGRVITPDDADYDKVRTVFYGGIDRRPAVIVRVANATTSHASSRWRVRPGWSLRSAVAVTATPATASPTEGSCSISRT